MPNYVYNTIKFKEEDGEKFEEFMNGENFDFNKLIQMPKEFEEMGGNRGDIKEILLEWKTFVKDYKLTPQNIKEYTELFKQSILEKPEKYPESFKTVNSETVIKEWGLEVPDFQYQMYREIGKVKYGFSSWYDWRIENWGTKWNALETEIEEEYIYFATAWSTPFKIFIEMSKKNPKTYFQVKYYDEATGRNCGIIEYIPDLKIENNHNVAIVTYDMLTEELKIQETAFVNVPEKAEKKYNAFIENGLIVYDDYTDYQRFENELKAEEKKEYFKKWYIFAGGSEKDLNEINEED